MSTDKKLFGLYFILAFTIGLFILSLYLFVSDARKLHNEGALRRPQRHSPPAQHIEAVMPAPAVIDSSASTTLGR